MIKITHNITGCRLNSFFDLDCFDETTNYVVYSSIFYNLKDHVIKKKPQKRKEQPESNTCSKRLKGDKAISSLSHTIKRVSLNYEGINEIIYSELKEDFLKKNIKQTKK